MTGTDVDELVGSLLAERFRITGLLGRGGMASVYLAEDETLGRTVAVKLFRRDLADGDELQRQQEEIQLLARLNHPALVTLYDASVDASGAAFIVMELVPGTDLHSRLRDGVIEPVDVAELGRPIADALAYVHSQGVIHRDIKPGNILLPTPGSVGPPARLADFGVARIIDGSRLTATGKVLGTANYFSPEQALGEPIGPASDIYSLGLVLLECLTGEKAFPGTPVESMTARLARDPVVPAELGDSWAGLLRGMTNRNPDARPTARDVAGVLARLADPTGATRPYPVPATTAAMTQETARFDVETQTPLTAEVTAADPPEEDAAETRTVSPARRILLTAAVIVVVALLAWLAVSLIAPLFASDPPPPVDYPAVEGPLGEHLEQLQRSVEP